MKFTDYVPAAAQHVLIYGPPKSGKTQLAGELARKHKLLWFDLENGVNTLLKLPKEAQANIELVKIADSRTQPIATESMLRVITGTPVLLCNEHGRYNCMACKKAAGDSAKPEDYSTRVCLNELPQDVIVVIDSATQLSNSIMAKICNAQPDDYQPTFHDYRNQGAVLDKIYSNIQAASYHCVVISHEMMVPMQDGTEKIVPIGGTSNFSKTFAKYFDHVLYCEVKAKQHKTGSATTYSMNILTGSRTDLIIEKDGVSALQAIFTQPKRAEVNTKDA